MPVTRRRLVTASAATAVAAALPCTFALGQGAEFNYRYADNLPASHPLNVQNMKMAQAVREETSGRLSIQVFPASQLGSDTDMLKLGRSGGLEFFTLSGLLLAALVPQAAISGIGFAFSNYASVWRAMDGDLGAYIRRQITKTNLVAMDRMFDNGFRQMTSWSKPIHSPQDLQGMRMRVPVSPLWISMFEAFGALPAGINASQVYGALKSRQEDGQENPLTAIMALKLYEVQKYCAITNHMWDGFWFLANRRAWERLPANLREIVARHVNAAAMRERADLAVLARTAQKQLAAQGMVFHMTETEAFREKLRAGGFYTQWRAKTGEEAWALLERHTGKLG